MSVFSELHVGEDMCLLSVVLVSTVLVGVCHSQGQFKEIDTISKHKNTHLRKLP